jgi:type II secretory pathway predicted ATPase ExeA
MTEPDNNSPSTLSTLSTIVHQIRDWQLARALSDAALVKKFSGLGSTKTFKSLLEGNLDGYDIEHWRVDYEKVLMLMELEAHFTDNDEPTYDDLSNISNARMAVQDAMGEKGNNRLVIIEGPSGSGKTTSARCLAALFGSRVVLAEADETWKESLAAMLAGILRALGVREIPASADDRKTKVLQTLSGSPVCLVIDEAHHLGPRTLNMVKTILNQTRCQVVFLCIPTLFVKLESSAYEEAKQLTKNRLAERVRITSPSVSDVEKFLDHRLNLDRSILRACAKSVSERAGQFGCWNFVNLVCRKARQLAGKSAIDMEVFTQAIQKAQQSR